MRFFPFLTICVLFVSCTFSPQDCKEVLRSMRGKTTVIPFDKMVCWLNDSIIHDTITQRAKYKLVVYVDSAACSTCYLNEMYQWHDFVALEEDSCFSLCFIFAPPLVNRHSLQNHFFRTELNHPIYVDTSYCFLNENPHIPSSIIYHTFLLDGSNKIALVGNPLHNKKIEKLLRNHLDRER